MLIRYALILVDNGLSIENIRGAINNFNEKLVDVANKFHWQIGKRVSLPERTLSTGFLPPFYQLGIAGELHAATECLTVFIVEDEDMAVKAIFQVVKQIYKSRAIGKHLKELVCVRQETGKEPILENSSLLKVCDEHR